MSTEVLAMVKQTWTSHENTEDEILCMQASCYIAGVPALREQTEPLAGGVTLGQ